MDKAVQEANAPTISERFTNLVMAEFGRTVKGAPLVTDYQKQLIQGYFIGIDRSLKTAEEARIRKNAATKDAHYHNTLPVVWQNVNLADLALDLMHYAKMGLDMMQDNHLAPVRYKDNKTGRYNVTLMPGYNGVKYIAERYAVETPTAVTIELVYSTDIFRTQKKSKDNKVESYDFEITNPFDRGQIMGGFGYIEYADPTRNRLVIMPMGEIMKRKPLNAPPEFWGGKTTRWVDGKPVEVETEGWFEQMVYKTVVREVYGARHIPRDPKKIDDAYHHMRLQEAKYAGLEAQAEIEANANTILIDATPSEEAARPEAENPQPTPQKKATQPDKKAAAPARKALQEPDF